MDNDFGAHKMVKEPQPRTDYDVMVIGSGIGGMESSIKLGDMGYKVLLVEKEASVGGRMILLSKVFPTLDCASCISGPKMSSTINHPNITTKNYSEVLGIERDTGGVFNAKVKQSSTFVDWNACTGCSECETACTVAVPDQFNYDLVARRAAYIAFPQAVPKKAVIERDGTSPCIAACPAGIKAHGYVSLTRAGRYEEADDQTVRRRPALRDPRRTRHRGRRTQWPAGRSGRLWPRGTHRRLAAGPQGLPGHHPRGQA